MKTIFYGISLVALAGLAIGGALRPAGGELVERESAPRQEIGFAAEARGGPEYAVQTGYRGAIPDYVVGTDNLRGPAVYEAPAEAYEDYAAYRPVRGVDYDLPLIEPASYEPYEPVRSERPRYPSEGGGILAGIDPSPAYPMGDSGELIEPADAPPGAFTGDTVDAVAAETGPRQPMSYAEIAG
jgi:hypothetical protein